MAVCRCTSSRAQQPDIKRRCSRAGRALSPATDSARRRSCATIPPTDTLAWLRVVRRRRHTCLEARELQHREPGETGGLRSPTRPPQLVSEAHRVGHVRLSGFIMPVPHRP